MRNNDTGTTPHGRWSSWAIGLFAALLLIDLAFIALHIGYGWSVINLDEEGTLPVWYSSNKLLLIAAMCVSIWWVERKPVGKGKPLRLSSLWLVIGAVFLFLSADETASMHERFARIVMEDTSVGLDIRETLLHGDAAKDSFAWVLLLSPAILAVTIVFAVFFYKRLRVSPSVYIGAMAGLGLFLVAVGLEATMFGTPSFKEWTGAELSHYRAGVAVEEAGEMLGSTFFVLAFVRYRQYLDRRRRSGAVLANESRREDGR